jgi:diadenosine tetraphosphate (Ap4A) HIT family hydrolase
MDLTNETDCCRFCSYFSSTSVDPVDAPWLRDDDYCAMVSKGALVPGWTLICPLRHGYSLANDYRLHEFWSFSSKAEAIIRARYGDVQVFEHGASHAGSPTGCGTDHAHLHMVPLAFSVSTEALRYDAALEWVSCQVSDIGEQVAGREYLFVSDRYEGDQTAGLLCLLETPVSQFFRRVVASRLGLREFYDYRRHPMLEIARSSASNLRSDVLAGVRVGAR